MYNNLQEFYRATGIAPMKERWTGQTWRIADQTIGHLRACPRLRGFACATDGVLLLVLLESGEVIKGHLDNWLPDKDALPGLLRKSGGTKSAASANAVVKDNKKASAKIWTMLTE